MESIKVKNAYLHNLKHVDVEIPKNKFVVVTGVSGSGKTSLFSDILDEVGCCEYLESLGLPQQTSVHEYYESITGLNPTISVKSSSEGRWNPRSTVGTKTGILDYLRLLYLAEGETECLSYGKRMGSMITAVPVAGKSLLWKAVIYHLTRLPGNAQNAMGRDMWWMWILIYLERTAI